MIPGHGTQFQGGFTRWPVTQQPRPAPRAYIALACALCAALLLSGCNTRANKNLELVKRMDDEDIGCYLSPAATVVRRDLAYIANHSELVILDVSDPLTPQCIASLEAQPLMEWSAGKWRNIRNVRDVAIVGHYAYLAANGLVVVDISDPQNLQEVSVYDIDTAALDIKLKGNYAFLAAVRNGLLIFDVSDPAQPELVSQLRFPDAAVMCLSIEK